jgi:D-alanyl-D-alanine carboxypeptidase/D-alanyl-D-alanine-endopeptidase (penicillin-binding protein 4)
MRILTGKNLNHQSKIVNLKLSGWMGGAFFVLMFLCLLSPVISNAGEDSPCLKNISSQDALVVAGPGGEILYKKCETKKHIPASTLKLLSALTAIRHFGASYRFKTEFYMDADHNMKIKGFGDPLLVSEAWQEIADALAKKTKKLNNLILDDTYFSPQLIIPGSKHSTNPYDAPVGALCANFNTVFFHRDHKGRIVSSEPQTPLIPYAKEKIQELGLKQGRYTFSHDQKEIALYAGNLLIYFLREKNVKCQGKVYLSAIQPEDRLIYTFLSRFTLEDVIRKMMAFSSNFIANQVFIALGAKVYGPPATLAKGVKVVSGFAKNDLDLKYIQIAEGSGISRKNRLSALDMLTILKAFEPHRHLLKKTGDTYYKTGTLRGIRSRVGYINGYSENPYYFVIFLNRPGSNIDTALRCITRSIKNR